MSSEQQTERLSALRRHLGEVVKIEHLTRFEWRKQTDAVQLAFVTASIFIDLGSEVVFVDGHINDFVKRGALLADGGVKQFFNRRFHDAGFKARRVIIFDTKGTRKMGGRGSGRDKLHFHAILERPFGWSDARLQSLLFKIFGNAGPMGKRQFHFSKPKWNRRHSHNGVRAEGPIGKMMYAIAHAGTTYANLGLNDGKRSRRAPPSRGACNRTSEGIARGIPSNFTSNIVFIDAASKRAGKQDFAAWVRAERAKLKKPSTKTSKFEATPTASAA